MRIGGGGPPEIQRGIVQRRHHRPTRTATVGNGWRARRKIRYLGYFLREQAIGKHLEAIDHRIAFRVSTVGDAQCRSNHRHRGAVQR